MAHRISDRVEADAFVPTGTNVPPEPGFYKAAEDVMGVHGQVAFDTTPTIDGSDVVTAGSLATTLGSYAKIVAAPSAADDTGAAGQIAFDADSLYICVDTDTWLKATIATWE